MAGPNVTISMSAADAGLVHAWQELKRNGPDAYEKSLAKVKGASRTLRSEIDSMIGGAIARYATLEFAVSKVADVIRKAIELQLQLNDTRNRSATTVEAAEARFLNQTSRTGASIDKRKSVLNATAAGALPYGVGPAESRGFASELATRGVGLDETSGVLQELLKFTASQNTNLDADIIQAVLQEARVTAGGDPTAAAVRQVTSAQVGLKETQLTPQQLLAFSRTNKSLEQAGMSTQERLAFNAASLNLYGDESRSATFNQAFVNKLRAPDKASKRALGQIVGNTDSVDFIGENMEQVLDKLAAGLEKLDERKRVPLLTQVFGQEYAAMSAAMINDRGTYSKYRKEAMSGGADMEESAARTLGTNAATQAALKAKGDAADASFGRAGVATLAEAVTANIKGRGGSGLEEYAARKAYETVQFIGGGTKESDARIAGAASAGAQSMYGSGGSYINNVSMGGIPAIVAALGEYFGGSTEKTNEILSEMNQKLDDKGVVIEGDETTNAKRRGTPAKAPLSGVGGR